MEGLPEIGHMGIQLVVDAGLAILGLLIAATLSVYKPWGRVGDELSKGFRFVVATAAVIVLVLVVLRHVIGGGVAGHHH